MCFFLCVFIALLKLVIWTLLIDPPQTISQSFAVVSGYAIYSPLKLRCVKQKEE